MGYAIMDKQTPIISFPWGAGGNHVRWLLFLDNSIHNPYTNGQSIDHKLDFIQTEVYNKKRTWNNWLQIEWQFRNQLDDQIKIEHELYDWETNETYKNRKILFLKSTDIDKTIAHYFHINSSLNSISFVEFREKLYTWNTELNVIANSDIKSNNWLITEFNIFGEQLDINIYRSIIDFFKFDDHYKEANLINRWYYEARIKSAKDFSLFLSSDDFQKYTNIIDTFGKSNV